MVDSAGGIAPAAVHRVTGRHVQQQPPLVAREPAFGVQRHLSHAPPAPHCFHANCFDAVVVLHASCFDVASVQHVDPADAASPEPVGVQSDAKGYNSAVLCGVGS